MGCHLGHVRTKLVELVDNTSKNSNYKTLNNNDFFEKFFIQKNGNLLLGKWVFLV